MINGNIEGIRRATLMKMEEIYDIPINGDEFAPLPLLESIAAYTDMINREIVVYISRSGTVLDVTIGAVDRAPLQEMRLRRSTSRLSGIRCIHTHPNGRSELSQLDIQSLSAMRLDAMAAVGAQHGRPTSLTAAILSHMEGQDEPQAEFYGPFAPADAPYQDLMEQISQAAQMVGWEVSNRNDQSRERAIMVGIDLDRQYDAMQELANLADTAGVEVVHREMQNRSRVDTAYYIGQGKAEQLALIVQSLTADVVIFDCELSGAQLRNLERELGCKVIDRTMLILDIFAQRAKSMEGKLQVELAQLKYHLPRLIGLGQVLSRLGGGIGTRGPGETKLEVDRRKIRRRIFELEQDVKRLTRQRDVRRAKRESRQIPIVALVGYTNAGKSTLLNQLSGSDVLAEDRLFATLDPVSRQVNLPDGRQILLVDTVGFIHKLPHDLVDAFRSTLEEAARADLILEIMDAASEEMDVQHQVVQEVLESLGAGEKPRLQVMNKIDRIDMRAQPHQDKTVWISAKDGQGMDELMDAIAKALHKQQRHFQGVIPYEKGGVLSYIHEHAVRIEQEHCEQGTAVDAWLMTNDYEKIKRMLNADT